MLRTQNPLIEYLGFMEAACTFLHCKEGIIPFKYLGLPVGANSKKMSTWEPMLDQLKKRLISWGIKYVSLGGRTVLLNFVLNAIPIFFLSYLKIPAKVLKSVTPRIPNNVNHTCKSEYYNVYGMLHFVKYLNNRVKFSINKVNIS